MYNVNQKTAPNIFLSRFQKQSYPYPTRFSELNYVQPIHNIKAGKHSILIRGPWLDCSFRERTHVFLEGTFSINQALRSTNSSSVLIQLRLLSSFNASQRKTNCHKGLKNEIYDYTHYAFLLPYYENEISDYAHSRCFTSLLFKWSLWLGSLCCLPLLLLNWNLELRTLSWFNSLILKWNLWLGSPFNFTSLLLK